jgi:hypothetical protein
VLGTPLVVTLALLFFTAPAIAQSDVAADALDRYLSSHDLTSLRFEATMRRIADGPADDRDRLVEQAADLLAELLESETNPDRQREWSERAKDLLRRADGAGAERLELQLLRAAYQRAERVAERWRLRTASEAETAAAIRTLTDAAARLERIARRADQRAEIVEQRLPASTGAARERLREEAETARARRSQARYLAGWSRLYMAQMTGDPIDAEKALASFAWILGSPGDPEPDLDDADPDNLKLDHVLRAALGTAAAHAELGRSGPARDWLLTAATHAEPDLADAVDGWRLVVDAELGRWNDLIATLDSAPDATAARIVAVAAIESLRGPAGGSSGARAALEAALSALVDLGDASSLVELSRRYGALPLSGRSFLARFTAGLSLYLDAESLFKNAGLPSDSPAPDGVHQRNFATAAQALQDAVDAADESLAPSVLAEARAVLGGALFYAAGADDIERPLPRAREHLMTAAGALTDEARRAGAMWLAIRAARLQAERSEGDAAREATRVADEIAARFLREFPQSDLAGTLLYEMAMRDGLDPRRRAELLSRVPSSSSAYMAARDQSARALYEIYRETDAGERTPAALRYLDAAETLLTPDLAAARQGDEQAAARALARARRMLDALLSMTPPDADRAASVLARVQGLAGAEEPDAKLELAYRRAQIAIISAAPEEAAEAVERLESLASGDDRAARYAEALRRFVFRRAVARHTHVRESAGESQVIADAARRVAVAGRQLLGRSPDFEDRAVRTAAGYLALALDDLATYAAEENARAEALDLRLELLERRPADAELLERVARGADHVGRPDVARDAWNRRLALLPVGSEEWFETRYFQLRSLARTDPDEARSVLRRQHRVLYPDYGPEPWGPKLKELDQSLGGDQ